MTKVFCRGCGIEMLETASACSACGAMTNPEYSSTKATDTSVQAVSDAWKQKFALIEKAGGAQLPKIRELAFGERFKIIFNVWGFLFGPIYYFAKGMWKKGIVIFAIGMALIVTLSMICDAAGISDAITTFIVPAIFARRSNIDFYKKIVLRNNGWW